MLDGFEKRRALIYVALTALTLTKTDDLAAQATAVYGSQEKSVQIFKTDTPPVIDGRLDDPAWLNAATVDDLHETQPIEYDEPSEPTLVYMTYDDNAIYFGAMLYDSNPALIANRILRQGVRIWPDDWFGVVLDTFNDKRSGYRFNTNPNGVRMEGIYQNATEMEWEWQGIWEAAGSLTDEGWIAEMAIPFKTLSFDPDNDTWGINFRRGVSRTDERMAWVSRNRETDPSSSGVVVGIESLEQGMGLDIVPSASLTDQHRFDGSSRHSDFDPSLDVFYKISPNVTSALTINTDFSATEVDDRQVNLTRFGLFFPEKRDFFLQDADIFEFGGLEQNGRPFFSRRIGLSGSGQPVDLNVGGKISGRTGRFNFGALAVRQDAHDEYAADNAIVARVSANVLSESTVGIIATEGDPNSSVENSVIGADFSYRNTRLGTGKLLEGNAWVQESDSPGVAEENQAYGLGMRMPNSIGFGGGIRYSHIEENFDPALGFVNRPGIDQVNGFLQYTIRPEDKYLRSIQIGFSGEHVERIVDGATESSRMELRLIDFETRVGDEIRLRPRSSKEVLFEEFEISEGIVIPVGSYSFDDVSFRINTGNQRKVWGNLNIRRGDFYTGTRAETSVSVGWRPSGRLLTSLGYQYNDIDLAEGSFETRLVQFRTEIVFSSQLSWVTLMQYDNVSETVGINSRLHWVPEAGREGFLVLNHNLTDLDRDNNFRSSFSEAAIKFNYTFRF